MINNTFWKYSTKRYAESDIAQMSLQWQNNFNANINLILLADWLGSQCVILSKAQWQAINACIMPWHNEVILPLRNVRNTLKSKISNKYIYQLRDNIKEQEFIAEQISQSQLYDYCKKNIIGRVEEESCSTSTDATKQNIQMYLSACCGIKKIDDQQVAVFL